MQSHLCTTISTDKYLHIPLNLYQCNYVTYVHSGSCYLCTPCVYCVYCVIS
jgi:hypothetical protein